MPINLFSFSSYTIKKYIYTNIQPTYKPVLNRKMYKNIIDTLFFISHKLSLKYKKIFSMYYPLNYKAFKWKCSTKRNNT